MGFVEAFLDSLSGFSNWEIDARVREIEDQIEDLELQIRRLKRRKI